MQGWATEKLEEKGLGVWFNFGWALCVIKLPHILIMMKISVLYVFVKMYDHTLQKGGILVKAVLIFLKMMEEESIQRNMTVPQSGGNVFLRVPAPSVPDTPLIPCDA